MLRVSVALISAFQALHVVLIPVMTHCHCCGHEMNNTQCSQCSHKIKEEKIVVGVVGLSGFGFGFLFLSFVVVVVLLLLRFVFSSSPPPNIHQTNLSTSKQHRDT